MFHDIKTVVLGILFCWTFDAVNLSVINTREEINGKYEQRYQQFNSMQYYQKQLVFQPIYNFLECSGKVVLLSSIHDNTLPITAERLQQNPRRKRGIRRRDFDLIEMTGNCQWSVGNNYWNGQSFSVLQPGIHEPGWAIRAVKLL